MHAVINYKKFFFSCKIIRSENKNMAAYTTAINPFDIMSSNVTTQQPLYSTTGN